MKNSIILKLAGIFAAALFLYPSCATIMEPGTPKSSEKILLQYPVVLVHGIVFNDQLAFLKPGGDAWGRIPETLERYGARVYFGNTDAWGTYETNALLLRATINRILLETKKEKVNIIAHSKGGIDSRYMIWKYDFGGKVASLTTICTPHRGAEIADLIYREKIIHGNLAQKALELYGSLSGDMHPDLSAVHSHLTTAEMEKFNEEVVMDKSVYFQSLYTTMANALDDRLFFYSYREIYKISGKNDGIVSEVSARWGDNVRKISGGISHTEILDLKRERISGVDIPAVYAGIIRDLQSRGF